MRLIETPTTEANARNGDVPCLSHGTELLGPYEGSGFTTPQFLVRRHDGQVIRVSQLLYLITAQMDGRQDLDAIAHHVSEELDRTVTASDVAHLVDTKLNQLGIVDGIDTPAANAVTDPLLGLRLRSGLVPERLHRGVTNALRPAFAPVVVVTVLAALIGLDTWLIAFRRSAVIEGWIEILTRPGLFLVLTAVTFLAMAFHEFGHAAACRYSGGKPGAMGVGVYIVWPAFFTDVSDAYRLDRRGRLRTDLGGIYFNAIFALAVGGAYVATGFAPFVVMSVMTQVQALYQLVPFLRLDGYYILGDLIGVPNPFAYVRATCVAIFAPRHSPARSRAQASLHTIKRSARITLTVWVLVAIPALIAALAFTIYLMPRTVPVLYSSLRLDTQIVANGVGTGDWIGVANGATQFVFLLLPVLGWLSTFWFLAKMVRTRQWARNLVKPRLWPRPVSVAVAAAVAVGALAVTLQLQSATTPAAEQQAAPAAPELQVADLLAPVTLELADEAPPSVGSGPSVAAVAAINQPVAPVPVAPVGEQQAQPVFARWSLSRPVGEVNAMADGVAHHDIAIGTWQVEYGDDFWHMAEQILTDAYRRAPTPAEHGAYWVQLVNANRDRLVYPDNPSAIFAGQEFTVILPAFAQDHPSLFGDAPHAALTMAAPAMAPSPPGGSMSAPP